MHASFLLITARAQPGQDIEVVYVQCWANFEDFGESLERSARTRTRASSSSRFKMRIQLPPPRKQTIDWRHEAPYPAAIVASPTSYGASEAEGDFMMFGGGAGEPQELHAHVGCGGRAWSALRSTTNGEPEAHMTFSQPWVERELVLPDAASDLVLRFALDPPGVYLAVAFSVVLLAGTKYFKQ
ncbi:hypothetical protein EXIGLDRAFT_762502 [Exidia glandulosa HHB12029]|uniref:Uncharacterized protein n=1 Tax=Exidia glandulosa HHB12029 TaxID=1314781 RepID=A0A165MR37_EXIGL|nr:hypothetical protein EXIGLDRAFT_762502 [Exidia glandulosa HHB12029]